MTCDPRLAGVAVALPSRRVLKAFDRRRVATKAEPHAERPVWGPHPDPAIAAIEREFFRVGNDFLRYLYAGALGKPVPTARSLQKAFTVPGPKKRIDGWGSLLDLFNKRLPPEKLLEGWDIVIHRLSSALLPGDSITVAAERMALRSHLLWKLGQRALHPEDLPWLKAKDVVGKAQAASMEWAKAHGCMYLQKLTDEARNAVREVLVASKEAGEGSTQLGRRLFDRVSHLNRDWRRIALTETAMAVGNGQLASALDSGVPMVGKWMASPMACKHCLAHAGKTFDILPGPDLAKGDSAVWPGKNNVGRSAYKWSQKLQRHRTASELYWPCTPLHPYCCCTLLLSPKKP